MCTIRPHLHLTANSLRLRAKNNTCTGRGCSVPLDFLITLKTDQVAQHFNSFHSVLIKGAGRLDCELLRFLRISNIKIPTSGGVSGGKDSHKPRKAGFWCIMGSTICAITPLVLYIVEFGFPNMLSFVYSSLNL